MGSRPPQAEAAPCPPSARAPLSARSFLPSGRQIKPSLEVEKVVPWDPPPSLCPLERVTAQSEVWVQGPEGGGAGARREDSP